MKIDGFSRIIFYLLYDADGIIDNYIPHFLEALSENLSRLVVICNGKLTPEGRKALKRYTGEVIVCDNPQIDMKTYGIALNYVGRENLKFYDEVTFINNSIMGPLYPLNSLFEAMGSRSVDIWGIVHNWNIVEQKKMIPLDFISFRRSVISSPELQRYFGLQGEPVDLSAENAITFYNHFKQKGFILDTFIDDNAYLQLANKPNIICGYELIVKEQCPVFWKEAFEEDYSHLIDVSLGNSAIKLYNFIEKKHAEYLEFIWPHLLRTCHQSDLVRNLHLDFVLPTQNKGNVLSGQELNQYKLALIVHIYRPELLEEYMEYISHMPEETDVFITTDSKEKKISIQEKCKTLKFHNIQILIIQNRGRDVSSKLIGVGKRIASYDLVCCVHDKKTPHLTPQAIGEGFGYKCYANILFSSDYVLNVIKLFKDNPYMGIAVPPEPNHATMFTTLGYEWVGNYETTVKLAKRLKLSVPMAEDKEPVAPYGSFFWFRPVALKRLFEFDWKYEDFPKEPIADDGTILHAIERIYPFVAQQEGYYPAVIMADEYARIEFSNLRYYLREYNKRMIGHGIINNHKNMLETLNRCLEKNNCKIKY